MSETIYISVRKVLGRLKRKAFRTNEAIWFCCDLELCQLSDCAGTISMNFNDLEGSIEYIREKAKDYPWVFLQKEIDAARQYRHIYPVLSYSNKKTGYIKIARNRAYVEDFDDFIDLREDEAFVCDTFIEPECRGKGLSKTLLSQTIAWLRNNQVKYLFCHIPDWNEASLKLYHGFGFKKIHKVRHFMLFGVRHYTCTPKNILSDGRKLYVPE